MSWIAAHDPPEGLLREAGVTTNTLQRCTIGLLVASALLALYVAHQAIALVR